MPRRTIASLLAFATLGVAPVQASPLDTWNLRVAQATDSVLTPPAAGAEQTERSAILQHHQLQLHQGFGLATLGSMALTAGLGLYSVHWAPGSQAGTWQGVHVAMGGITTGLYLGAATLALTAPPGYDTEAQGPLDSVSIHRDLAWLHAASLLSTVVLGILTYIGQLNDPTWHGILGGTTLGLMAVSAGVIALDF